MIAEHFAGNGRSPGPEARDVPGGAGRGTSQPKHENLRRSPSQGRKATQGYHQRIRQKAGHHRLSALQNPSEMGSPGSLKDTVARSDAGWRNHSICKPQANLLLCVVFIK